MLRSNPDKPAKILQNNSRKYRPDIDGLRAVAIVAVLFFHTDFALFSGGFVGVDIFFVISGFLITRIVLSDLERDQFSFGNFYIRRVRRLFPALFFTLVVSFIAGFFILGPTHYEQLAQSTVYAVLSLSNFLFWSEAGYFDTEKIFKPLLHTWSLGVEEQFYLLWPFLLVLMVKIRGEKAVAIALVALGIVSLSANEIWIREYPDAVFYLMPFRIFEFAIGAAVVWLARYPLEGVTAEIISITGLSLIIFSILNYTSNTQFPGIAALAPCIGTGMLILTAPAFINRFFLANPVSVGIGRISYSLYLVHWPVIIYLKYRLIRPLTLDERVSVLFFCFLAAYFMYRFVENPFRSGRFALKHTPTTFGLASSAATIILVFVVTHAWADGGWPWRISSKIRNAVVDIDKKRFDTWANVRRLGGEKSFQTGKRRVLVVGDSHAKELLNAFLQLPSYERMYEFLPLVGDNRCQPVVIDPKSQLQEFKKWRYHDECKAFQRDLLESPLIAQADIIVLAPRWRPWTIQYISQTVSRIRQSADNAARIVVMGRKPEFQQFDDIPKLVFQYGRIGGIGEFIHGRRDPNAQSLDSEIKEMAEAAGAQFVKRNASECDDQSCDVFDESGNILYYDSNHWTMEGAQYFANRMLAHNKLAEILR